MAQQMYSGSGVTTDARGNAWYTDPETGARVPVLSQTDAESGDAYYTGYDQDATEAGLASNALYQTNLLNSVTGDAFRFQPGTQITPDEFGQFYARLINPMYTQDAPKTIQDYLNDPRAVVRYENGNLVYRPDLATGDYKPVDYSPKSFGDMVRGFISTPQFQIVSSAFGGGGLSSFASVAGQAASQATDNPLWRSLGGLVSLGSGIVNGLSEAGSAASAGDEFLDTMSEFVPGGAGALEAETALQLANLSQEELAQLVESGTVGDAGVALESAAGINSAPAATGLVDSVLKQAKDSAISSGIKTLLSPGGSSAPTLSGGASTGTTAPASTPVDTSGLSVGVSPGANKTLQMLSGGSVYDDAGNIRSGLISPYLKRA